MKQAKPSEIHLSPVIAKAVTKFHDKSMRRMATVNARDVPKSNLFHYTNEKAFRSIVDSGKFWFTSIYHMDDTEEMTFGFNVARSLLKIRAENGDQVTRLFCEELAGEEDLKKIRTMFEFYSVSFGERDDPQQWKSYADQAAGSQWDWRRRFLSLLHLKIRKTPSLKSTFLLGKSFPASGRREAALKFQRILPRRCES